jgi:uncharacterized BrkB/YihY/UPF0761 family membrane protein
MQNDVSSSSNLIYYIITIMILGAAFYASYRRVKRKNQNPERPLDTPEEK